MMSVNQVLGILPSKDLLLLQHAKAPLIIEGEDASTGQKILLLKPNPEEIYVYYPDSRKIQMFDKLVYQGGTTLLVKSIIVPQSEWELLEYAGIFYAIKKITNKGVRIAWGFPTKDEEKLPTIARVTIPISLAAGDNTVRYVIREAIKNLHTQLTFDTMEAVIFPITNGEYPVVLNAKYCANLPPEEAENIIRTVIGKIRVKSTPLRVENIELTPSRCGRSGSRRLNVVFRLEEDEKLASEFEERKSPEKLKGVIDRERLMEEVNAILSELGDVSEFAITEEDASEDYSEMEFFGRTLFEKINSIVARKNLYDQFIISGAMILDSPGGQYVIVMGDFKGGYMEFIDLVLKDALVEMLQKWGSKLSRIKKVVFVIGGDEE